MHYENLDRDIKRLGRMLAEDPVIPKKSEIPGFKDRYFLKPECAEQIGLILGPYGIDHREPVHLANSTTGAPSRKPVIQEIRRIKGMMEKLRDKGLRLSDYHPQTNQDPNVRARE